MRPSPAAMLPLLLALAALPRAAAAQEPPAVDPIESMPVRFGPLGLAPSIQITNVGIESNVFNEPDHPRSDFTATIAPSLVARLRAGRVVLGYTASSGMVYFRKFHGERSMNGSTDLRADFNLGAIQPFVTGSFVRTRERPNAEIDARAHRSQPAYSAGVTMNLASRTALVLTVRRQDVKYDADERTRSGVALAPALNERITSGDVALRVKVSPFTTVSVVGSVQQDRFVFASDRDADSVRILPTIEFAPEALLNGSFGIGYRRFRTLDPAVPDYAGLLMRAGVGWTLLGVTKVDLALSRDVQYSFEAATPFYVQTITGLTITQALGAGIDVRAVANRQTLAYQAAGDAEGRTDHVDLVGAGTGYRFRGKMRLGINWDYARRRSAESDRQYVSRRLYASLTFGT
ncbi:MAG: hypothetical protein A3H96_24260 [Acidobacteria bacterium RIFCSPLOWO2_02_FULL_67_36]|nr:MAG: hypothetical protein A3H96_24260 [Acidobacteria bacterium RIFCSPLOWO2_02_FULL_67_36]OFW18967.1 MAG: hypothetical protein A3G21_04510 [Acidobacteria bacterium RIFCSPLOWO2_12_FULL_66_21]